VLDYQSEDSFKNAVLRSSSLLVAWVVPKTAPLKPITFEEEQKATHLGSKKAYEYKHSRGYVRDSLSVLLKVPALSIPLNAEPGKTPQLEEGWGYISFSHCAEALLIAWSNQKIGVDIESKDRKINIELLSKRYFHSKNFDKKYLNQKEKIRIAILEQWVAREAAIKWQEGKLSKDFRKWDFDKSNKLGIHNSLGYSINIEVFNHQGYLIAIALEKKLDSQQTIICQA